MSAAQQFDLTDWIPCTTPPVRDGWYEVERVDGKGIGPLRVFFRAGRWSADEGGLFPDHADINPSMHRWRGRRMWVLLDPPCCSNHEPVYLERASTRGVGHWHSDLSKAQGFDSEAAALAVKRKLIADTVTVKAVLP